MNEGVHLGNHGPWVPNAAVRAYNNKWGIGMYRPVGASPHHPSLWPTVVGLMQSAIGMWYVTFL